MTAAEVQERWRSATPDERREMLRRLVPLRARKKRRASRLLAARLR